MPVRNIEIVVREIGEEDDEVPIYEGKDVSFSDEFNVEIEESGTYTVTVTGKKQRTVSLLQ